MHGLIPLLSKMFLSLYCDNYNIKKGLLLFNSLSELQTKPLLPIRHICDFSRGVLNVRFMRPHPTTNYYFPFVCIY
ncbi:hypothetical protein DXD91_05825 [Anaerobutyricum hallii]|uniref:Uncharacterized protein n=1 Tax=Anaerobutyricum hallii TaxID=39488 RepID=A0A374NR86_9FIRM|nr:hypothetical protein DXD91_05825 [Anaerobutyricum hallii]